MNSTVQDAINEGVAALVPLVPTPTPPLGYGRDLSVVTDATPTLDEVDPFTLLAIGQATVRRLTTERGLLPDDPNYGLDIRRYCNKPMTTAQLGAIASAVGSEVSKDDRIESADVSVALQNQNELLLTVRITAADPDLGPFDLVLAVTSVDVIIDALRGDGV